MRAPRKDIWKVSTMPTPVARSAAAERSGGNISETNLPTAPPPERSSTRSKPTP
ncbi:MAG: hypothetical protein M3Q49_21810 [Actinomycetota bacterium]|nr:hypothetical protein [Actinomycetota bacterium]